MRFAGFLLSIAAPVAAAAQIAPPPPPTVVQIQQWFEAGRYDDVIEAAETLEDPRARYIAAVSFERLGRMDQARQTYMQLVARGDSDPWALIGRSAQALSTVSPTAAALPTQKPPAGAPLATAEEAAARAVQLATAAASANPESPHPALAMAHYQLGLVQAHRNELDSAAASFGRAVTADPSFAYAHYYAGLMYSRLQREDQALVYWEAFLKLAPMAPEVEQVQSILPALGGR